MTPHINNAENEAIVTPANPSVTPDVPKTNSKRTALVLLAVALLGFIVLLAIFWFVRSNPSNKSAESVQTGAIAVSPLPAASAPVFPQPNMTLKINSMNTNGQTISGGFLLTNTSSVGAANLYYDVTLRSPQKLVQLDRGGKKINAAHQDLIAYVNSPQGFPMKPGQSQMISFQLPYNSHIPPGVYTVQVTVVSNLGVPIATSAQTINLTGRGDILVVTPGSCKITVNNQDYTPNAAYPVDRNSPNQGVCTFTNNTGNAETFGYNMTYAVQHVIDFPSSRKSSFKDQKTVTFKPGETKVVAFTLPTNLDPQVYEGYVSLTDSQNQPQSPLVPFRWTIKGQSGKIESIKLDKDYYSQNNQAQVTTTIDPSMDLYWRSQDMSLGTGLNNTKAVVSLTSNGKPCGSQTFSLPGNFLTPASFAFSVPIQHDCLNPAVQIDLLSNNIKLASANYGALSVSPKQVQKPSSSNLATIIFGAILVVLLVIIVVLLLKNGGNKKTTTTVGILLLVAISLIFLKRPVPIRAGGIGGTAVPAPGPIYVSTDGSCSGCHWGTVTFNGSEDQFGNVVISGTNWNQMGCSNYEITADISGPGIPGWVDGLGPNTSWSYTVYNVSSNATYYVSAESNQYDHCGCSCGGVGSWANNNGFPNQYGVINVQYCPCTNSPSNYCGNQTVPDACGNPVCGAGTEQPSCVNGAPVCGGTCDKTPPVVSLSAFPPPGNTCLTPSNLGVGSAQAHATDDISGVAVVNFNLYDSAGNTLVGAVPGSRISGTALDGYWQNSQAFPTASMITGHIYYITASANDALGNGPNATTIANGTDPSAKSPNFDYDANACIAPFLQTTQGNVFTNGNLNAPGGP